MDRELCKRLTGQAKVAEISQRLYLDSIGRGFDQAVYEEMLGCLWRKCESPIEMLLGTAFLHLTGKEWGATFAGNAAQIDAAIESTPAGHNVLLFSTQIPIAGYRADFIVALTGIIRPAQVVIVECDGHDFHEKTKQQAAHDKRRDRKLQAAGYRVLRFTGSEIYADPIKCAQEVEDALFSLAKRAA
jgi:very-short-patch-repair endonuclease